MNQPLYKDHGAPKNMPNAAHPGLWFERFFSAYDPVTWKITKPGRQGDPRLLWLENLTARAAGDPDALREAADTRYSLAKALGGGARCYITQGPFATGLGLPHPIENGFSWHPTLGVPYLTGAAVKGLLRAWLEVWEPLTRTDLDDWFGTTESAGRFICFDALPLKPVSLTADVMPPHMGKWYAKGATIKGADPEVAPADWHDPIPVRFLAVKQAQLVVALAPRRAQDVDLVPTLFEHLTKALAFIGAGAKTAAGYGRFGLDESGLENLAKEGQRRRDDLERQRIRAEMDPFDLELQDMIEGKDSPDALLEQALKGGRWQGEQARRAAEKARQLMKVSKKWRPTSNKKKDKAHKRTKWFIETFFKDES